MTPDPSIHSSPSPHRTRFLLLMLTAGAAALRLFHLSHPCLWGDEGLVYWRVCGSFRELMDILRSIEAFMPLLYQADWLLGQWHSLSPAMLRLIPTLCGIMMVPALYWLAWELLRDRGTAIWSAALAASSAFLWTYSRDAKPYMPLWFFEVCCIASLLWWLRTARRQAWLCWAATGTLMIAFNMLGMTILALQGILLAFGGAPRRRVPAFIAGVALIMVGPAVYYQSTHWASNVNQQGWSASGLDWIADSIRGYSAPSLSINALCVYLDNWAWIERGLLPRWIFAAEMAVPAIMLLCIGLGLWPWRKQEHVEPDQAGLIRRASVWIAATVIAPPYIFYCLSVSHPSNGWIVWAAVAALFLLWRHYRPDIWPRGQAGRVPLASGVCVLVICMIVLVYARTHVTHAVWVPRYLGTIWPALAIGICAVLGRIPWTIVRYAALLGLIGVNLIHVGARFTVQTEAPRDLIATDIAASHLPESTTRVFTGPNVLEIPDEDGQVVANPVMRYYLLRAAHRTVSPRQFISARLEVLFRGWRFPGPDEIGPTLASDPRISRLIVWTYSPPQDDLPGKLGPGWENKSVEVFPVRTRSGLGLDNTLYRAVYVRR